MKKKNVKYLFGVLLIGIAIFPSGVIAGNATASFGQYPSIEKDVIYKTTSGESKILKNNHIAINYNGNTYRAYCLDFNYKLPTEKNIYTCKESNYKALDSIMDYKVENKDLDIRIPAMIVALREKASQSQATKVLLNSTTRYTNIEYVGARGKRIEELAKKMLAASYGGFGSVTHRTPIITVALKSAATENGEYKATYKITNDLVLNNVKIECSHCTINGQKEWSSWEYNGTNEINLKVTEPNCSFSINISYDWDTAQTIYCSAPNGQHLYAKLLASGTSKGRATFEYKGTVDSVRGGEYYQKYCAKTPSNNQQPCEERDGKFYGINGTEVSEEQYRKECDNAPEPVTCTEKTTIEKPEYCDDSKDQYITITSPKNVKYCILNNKDDAGNTYKATNVIPETNPYCSVYCKEDYKITMPGAQYANSGRYFSLKNTAVNGTKSCFVTGTDGNNGIDLAKYRTNVINAQTKLKDEFNAYSRQKAIYEASQHPIAENISNCEGHSTGTKYIIPANSVQYTYFDIVCNGNNGVCSITSKTRTVTEEISWGTYGGTHDRPYDCSTLTEPNKTCHGCDDDPVTTHGSAPTAPSTQGMMYAQQALEGVIRNLQQCYNFDVNFCIDPTIDFDYNESYSSDIKFEKVSEKAEDIQSSYGTTIDNEYNTSGTSTLTNIGYIKCDTAGCRNGETPATNISNSVTYVKKVQNKTAEYNNTQEFQTNYPSGSIETLPPGSDVKHNYSYLGAVFPIALNTSRGVYKWTLNFTGMGQYNDSNSCKPGRLDEALKANNQEISAGIEYVCVYVVSCDECDYECVGEGCLIPDKPKCPECDVYCENCIFDGNMTYVYQAKSLNELSVHGSNWSTEKGIATKQEIETNGENIYIEEQYTYRLTPDMMKNLRDYNKEKGNYVPDDLSYHELSGVKNAYGTSDFLRNEKNENKYFKTIKRNEVWTLWEKIGDNMGRSWK